MSVFISHNKKDKNEAREIAMFLASESINVLFDEWEISAGDSITEEISNGLKGCTHFLILWSKNAAKSNWVRRELNSILSKDIQTGIPKVIPIVLDDTPLPTLIGDIKYIRFKGGTEKDRSNIVQAVTGESPSQEFIKAIVRKYHEIIHDEDSRGPFSLKACPQCGSIKLKGSSFTDYNRDEMYFILKCEECDWSGWTQ